MDPRSEADDAISGLYAAHARGLVRLAWLLLHDVGDSEEVVQDAFVALHRRWSALDAPASAQAYLRRAVVNGARSALRHRGVVVRHAAELRAEAATTAPGADTVAAGAAERAAVLGCLARLPKRQREVLVLRYYLDLSEHEIADTLGISPGSVKSHAHRGLAALRAGQEL